MGSTADNLCNPDELVRLMAAGNLEALDRMTRCYSDQLLAAGRKHCGDPDLAQDAVQDALLAAGTHLGDFRGDGSLEGWLVQMVANACRRMHRGRKNDPTLHTEHRDEAVGVDRDSPEAAAGRGELATALTESIFTLDARDRILVMLSDGAGWRAPEIAEKLDMTPGSVRTRLSRIRGRLREQLAPVWGDWSAHQR